MVSPVRPAIHRGYVYTSAYSRFGLILSTDLRRTGSAAKLYQKAFEREELVRVRRGAYCESSHWQSLNARERSLLRMRAVAAQASAAPVFSGPSAAAILGMPVLEDRPAEVHVLTGIAAGGRSRGDIRRHPIELPVDRIVKVDGLLAADVTATAIQLALSTPFAEGVGALDWALARHNPARVRRTALARELERLAPRYHAARAAAALEFAVDCSESFGESYTRAVMHELGYPTPELQVSFTDAQGFIGRVDYFWPSDRVVGEFDGASKYLRDEFSDGRSPSQIVWQEKQREDRLRRSNCDGVARMIWSESRNPPRLDAVLRAAGLRPSAR